MMKIINKGDAQRRRQANAQRYAPRVAHAQRATPMHEGQEPQLRRILVQTLDALKRPDAIPSDVIYAALKQARAAQ